MSIVLGFMAVIGAIAAWWLSQQRLMAKPWLETGPADAYPRTQSGPMPAAKVGMGVFLAVVGSLFALFCSAYFMRMGFSDWRSLPVPRILWLNTVVLVLSSVALQCAVAAARGGRIDMVRLGLVAGAMTAVAFLAGQWLAWRELNLKPLGSEIADGIALADFDRGSPLDEWASPQHDPSALPTPDPAYPDSLLTRLLTGSPAPWVMGGGVYLMMLGVLLAPMRSRRGQADQTHSLPE